MMIAQRRKHLPFKLLFLLSLLLVDDALADVVFVSTVVQVTKTLAPGIAAPTQQQPDTAVSSTGVETSPIQTVRPERQQAGGQEITTGDTGATATTTKTATASAVIPSESTTLITIALSNTATTQTKPNSSTATSIPSPSATSSAHKKLTTTATVAISCSAITFAVLVGLAMFCFFSRRRRGQSSSSSSSSLKRPRKKLQKKHITRKLRSSGHDLTSFSPLDNEAELGFVPVPLNPRTTEMRFPNFGDDDKEFEYQANAQRQHRYSSSIYPASTGWVRSGRGEVLTFWPGLGFRADRENMI